MTQLAYFRRLPKQEVVALEGALQVTREILRICAANRITLLCVYLPSPVDVQTDLYWNVEVADALGLTLESLDISRRLADGWLEGVGQMGVTTLDLRTCLREQSEPMYWGVDLHINVAAHSRIARELLPVVEPYIK